MAWIKLDDNYTEHPKILALGSDRNKWTWTRLLGYAAKQRNGGHIPQQIADVIRNATPAFLQRCVEVELLDVEQDGRYVIHDWAIYNGSSLEARVAAYLQAHPEAAANEVHKVVGGSRELVLKLVRQYRKDGT